MPLPVPNLDDRSFDQLATEARSLIARNFPAWTDHNLSDPGITLLELFAMLFESAIYQLNRVPERSLENFAGLVGVERSPGDSIEAVLRKALESLQRQHRAVTLSDFERLAIESSPNEVARARAVIAQIPSQPHQLVKVTVVPKPSSDPPDIDELCGRVFDYLLPRCLIATRLRVVGPDDDAVRIDLKLVRDTTGRLDHGAIESKTREAIGKFFDPLTGGPQKKGWEFGRSVFRSELYQIVEGVPGVDHVRQIVLQSDPDLDEVPLPPPKTFVSPNVASVEILDR